MKKVFLAVILALSLSSCSQEKSEVPRQISMEIKSQSESLDFSIIVPFEWDRVFFFGPYTPETVIEQAIGTPWKEYKKSGIGFDDSHTLILFESKGKVVGWCMNPRNRGEFASLYNSNGYTRAESTFAIEYTGSAKWPNIRKK